MAHYETFNHLPVDRIQIEHGAFGDPSELAFNVGALARVQWASGLGPVRVSTYMNNLEPEDAPPLVTQGVLNERAVLNGRPPRKMRPLGYSTLLMDDDFRFGKPSVAIHVNTLEMKWRIEDEFKDPDDPKAVAWMLDGAIQMGLEAAAWNYAHAHNSARSAAWAITCNTVARYALAADMFANGIPHAGRIVSFLPAATVLAHMARTRNATPDRKAAYNRWSLLPYMYDRYAATRGLLLASRLVATATPRRGGVNR